MEKLRWMLYRHEMTRRMEHGLGRGCGPRLYVACLLAAVILLLAGCRTVKSAESHTQQTSELKTDTTDVSSVQKDSTGTSHTTSASERETTRTESHTERRDSMVTVVDQHGNVVGTREYHWLRETLKEVSERERSLEDLLLVYRSRLDSTAFYRSKADSLSNVVRNVKTVEVERQRGVGERISTFLADALIGVFVFIVLLIAIRLIIRRLRR